MPQGVQCPFLGWKPHGNQDGRSCLTRECRFFSRFFVPTNVVFWSDLPPCNTFEGSSGVLQRGCVGLRAALKTASSEAAEDGGGRGGVPQVAGGGADCAYSGAGPIESRVKSMADSMCFFAQILSFFASEWCIDCIPCSYARTGPLGAHFLCSKPVTQISELSPA